VNFSECGDALKKDIESSNIDDSAKDLVLTTVVKTQESSPGLDSAKVNFREFGDAIAKDVEMAHGAILAENYGEYANILATKVNFR
jgi:hypothetical protein